MLLVNTGTAPVQTLSDGEPGIDLVQNWVKANLFFVQTNLASFWYIIMYESDDIYVVVCKSSCVCVCVCLCML